MKGYVALEVDVLKSLRSNEGKEFQALVEKLDAFWNKRIPRDSYDYYYVIPEDSDLLVQLINFANNNKRLVYVQIWSAKAEYTEEELSKAKAYIPTLDISCFKEYDDVDALYEYCDKCKGEIFFKKSELWDGTIYDNKRIIKPEGKIMKQDKCFVLRNEYDATVLLVSTRMQEVLLKEGVDERFFTAVYSKKGKLLGYELTANNLLPSESLSSKRFKLDKKCEACGNLRFEEQELLKYEPYYIQGIDRLPADVCRTSDYYAGRRMILISPRLRDLIVRYDSKASFMPVF